LATWIIIFINFTYNLKIKSCLKQEKIMQEKFINATQTQTTTQVSTKTKILLGLIIVASITGIFVVISLSINNMGTKKQLIETKKKIIENDLFDQKTGERILYRTNNGLKLEAGYKFIRINNNLLQIVKNIGDGTYLELPGGITFTGCDCFYESATGSCTANCSTVVQDNNMTSCSGSCTGDCGVSCKEYSVTIDPSTLIIK